MTPLNPQHSWHDKEDRYGNQTTRDGDTQGD